MTNYKYEFEFEEVTAKIRRWREEIVAELRAPETYDKALHIKRQLDAAIECLEFCQQHQISPDAEVLVLPMTQTRTPASNYRVLEDHETDQQEYWVELKINNQPLHLYPGDMIIS